MKRRIMKPDETDKPPYAFPMVFSDEYRNALKTILEWCRDSIDFNDETDAVAAKAFSIAIQPFLATLTPEEDAAWNYGFAFHANVGVDDDGAAYLTWMDLIEEFPRLKEYLGATTFVATKPKKVGMF